MDFHTMSCTKLHSFLENKKTAWFPDNITLAELQLIKRRMYQCSPKVYAKMTKFFGFVEQKIARQK